MTVRTDAAAALAARDADVQAQAAADRQALRDAVVPVLQAVLDDGGSPAVPLSSLTQDVADLSNRLVIVTDGSSDPTVSLVVQDVDGDGVWETHLVGLVDGGWTKLSGPLADLAALGEVLAGQQGG